MSIYQYNQGAPASSAQVPIFDTVNGQSRRVSMAQLAGFVAMQMQDAGYSLVIATVGIPPDSIGVDGQLAVDADAGVIYLKSGGHWALYDGGSGTPAPVFTSQPSITGTSQVGQVLTAVDGAASNTTTMTRKWYMDGAEIVGETGATYTPITGDVGKVPGLRNFATGPGGGPVQSSLAAAAAVAAASATAPGAPTIGVATAGNGAVSVAFTAPVSNGGSPIIDYQALLSTGQTATGASSPINVTAPNGTPVTATVRARNAVGYGPYSAASNSVTPIASTVTSGIVVSNRQGLPTNVSAAAIPALQAHQVVRRSHSAGATSNIRWTNSYWRLDAAFTPVPPTGSPTVRWQQYLEYPQGTFTPVLFAGGAICTMNPATQLVRCDPVAVTIPADTDYWIHTINLDEVIQVVHELPASSSTIGTGDAVYTAASASSPAHQGAGYTGSAQLIGPSLITGDVAAVGAQAWGLVGNSLIQGQGDIQNAGKRGSSGFIPRKMDLLSASYIKLSKGGGTMVDARATFTGNALMSAFLAQVLPAITHVIVEGGINDFLTASRSAAQLTADLQAIYGVFEGDGRILYQTTITPCSSGDYSTVGGQSARTTGTLAQKEAFNTSVRSLAVASRYIEIANVAQPSPANYVWYAPPTFTADGTHPNSVGCAYIAANTVITGFADTTFDPNAWAAAVEWWDANDNSKVYSDSAGATAAVAGTSKAGTLVGKKLGVSLSNPGTTSVPTYVIDANGRRIIKFTAASVQYLNAQNASIVDLVSGDDKPYAVVMAVKRGAAGVSSTPFSFNRNDAGSVVDFVRHFFGGSNTIGVSRSAAGTAVTAQSPGTPASANQWYVISLIFSGTAVTMRLGGVTIATDVALNSNAMTLTDMTLGATYSNSLNAYDAATAFDGCVGEVGLLQLVAPGDTTLAAAEAYLMSRWVNP